MKGRMADRLTLEEHRDATSQLRLLAGRAPAAVAQREQTVAVEQHRSQTVSAPFPTCS